MLGAKKKFNGIDFNGKVFADSGIESIRLPSTLRNIGDNLFKNCKKLKQVEFPQQLESIGERSFFGAGIV